MRIVRSGAIALFVLGVVLVQTGFVRAGSLDQQDFSTPAAQENQEETLRQEALGRIQETIDVILARMDAAIVRFETLLTRMESRRDILQAAGKDVTTVDSLLAVTEEHVTSIKLAHAALASDTAAVAEQPNPRAMIARAQREIPIMVEDLGEVLVSLKNIIQELKAEEEGGENGRDATPSGATDSASGFTPVN